MQLGILFDLLGNERIIHYIILMICIGTKNMENTTFTPRILDPSHYSKEFHPPIFLPPSIQSYTALNPYH